MASLARTILEEHLVRGELVPGQEIGIAVDQALAQDATGTMAMMQFELFGHDRVEVDTAVVYVDHNILQIDFKNPDDHRFLQAMAAKYGAWFSRPGNGICHYVHCERFAVPGKTLVGADSHTTQSGSAGMIAIGAGGLDVAVCMAGHPFELPCPKIVGVFLENELQRPWIQAKDVILELLRRRGVRGGRGAIFEFTGPGVKTLSYTERGTIANMIAELGATGAVFPADDETRAWFDEQDRSGDFVALETSDSEDDFDETEHIDLAALVPLVAKPSSPGNVVPVEELVGTELAQVCVGSSVNSSYEDMAVVGATLRGNQISEKLVSATATPGSRQILDQITQSGTYVELLSAGVRMLEPACGPCVGMGQAPPSGANSLRTFNRNFPGRSGTADDNVYLCSPAVAAVSMLKGEIADPREFDPPELPQRPPARPGRRPGAHPRAGSRRRGWVDRGSARPEHQAAAGAEGASGHARAARPDRGAGRHLDRRPLAGRRDRHGLSVERAGNRRVHVPAPRSGVPAPGEGVGRRVHRRRGQLRPGVEPRARGAGSRAARRAGGDRQELRADPPAEPDRAGNRPAPLQGRGRRTTRPSSVRRGGSRGCWRSPTARTSSCARSTRATRSRSRTTCFPGSARSSSPAGSFATSNKSKPPRFPDRRAAPARRSRAPRPASRR